MRLRAVLIALALIACSREERRFTPLPGTEVKAPDARLSALQPGEPLPDVGAAKYAPYASNAYGISQGKQLFSAFNCSGCHANGGGGMGPALMDERWIYGGKPEQIYLSIAQGRPNGMPSFAGKIPTDQLWQLTAYIRSMGGGVRADAAPGRADHMQITEPEPQRERQPVKGAPGEIP